MSTAIKSRWTARRADRSLHPAGCGASGSAVGGEERHHAALAMIGLAMAARLARLEQPTRQRDSLGRRHSQSPRPRRLRSRLPRAPAGDGPPYPLVAVGLSAAGSGAATGSGAERPSGTV